MVLPPSIATLYLQIWFDSKSLTLTHLFPTLLLFPFTEAAVITVEAVTELEIIGCQGRWLRSCRRDGGVEVRWGEQLAATIHKPSHEARRGRASDCWLAGLGKPRNDGCVRRG